MRFLRDSIAGTEAERLSRRIGLCQDIFVELAFRRGVPGRVGHNLHLTFCFKFGSRLLCPVAFRELHRHAQVTIAACGIFGVSKFYGLRFEVVLSINLWLKSREGPG